MAYRNKDSNEIEDPLSSLFIDLALQLYKPKVHGESLLKGVLKIIPQVTEEEVLEFKAYWLARESQMPSFPQLWQFKKWLDEDSKRLKKKHSCSFKICTGKGYIELYDPMKHGDDYAGHDYFFTKSCACIIGIEEHKKMLWDFYYTQQQIAVIIENKGDIIAHVF